MSFDLERFKKSNVARIFVGYAVVVFASMQILDYLLPIIEAPLWVAQTLTLILFLGFPISLLIGWATQQSDTDPSNVNSKDDSTIRAMPRQKLVVIGLGSSVLFGFLGLVLMPYMLDQAAFSSERGPGERTDNRGTNFISRRHQINLGVTRSRGYGSSSEISVSHDGNSIVFVTYSVPTMQINIKDLTAFDGHTELVQLSMNPDSGYPEISPDGQWVYYFENNAIKRIRIEGGLSQTVVETGAEPTGLSLWNDEIIYRDLQSQALLAVNVSTGSSRILRDGEDNALDYSWPHMMPSGDQMLATTGGRGSFAGSRIDMINLETGDIRNVVPVGFNARYSESGHVLFGRGSSLWAQPIDKSSYDAAGNATPVLFDFEMLENYGLLHYTLSPDGRLFYLRGEISADAPINMSLVLTNKIGEDTSVLDVEPNYFIFPQFSPDGSYMSYSSGAGGDQDVWVYDFASDIASRRGFGGDSNRAAWSDDSTQLIYQCGSTGICMMAANGTGAETEIIRGFTNPVPYFQYEDVLVLHEGSPYRIYESELSTTNPEVILRDLNLGPLSTRDARLSTDKKWLMYSSNESGRSEIYVRPYPDVTAGKWQVSRNGGSYPLWNDASKEVFWITDGPQRSVNSASYSLTSDSNGNDLIVFGNPQEVFELGLDVGWATTYYPWDFRQSTQEFVFVKDLETQSSDFLSAQTSLSVVENWWRELEDLAPHME